MTSSQPQYGPDIVRRDFIKAYAKEWGTTPGHAADLMEHIEGAAVEGQLRSLYKKLCGMSMGVMLTHGAQVTQGLALAIKEIHALLPEEEQS